MAESWFKWLWLFVNKRVWSVYFRNWWSAWLFQQIISFWNTQASFPRTYIEWPPISSEQQFTGKNALMTKVRGEWSDCFEQHSSCSKHSTQVCRRAYLYSQYVEFWIRWSTAAEDHNVWQSCQLGQETGNGRANKASKSDNKRFENVAWLISAAIFWR